MDALSWQVRRYDRITYETFLRDHLILNRPLILDASHTASWSAAKAWRIVAQPCERLCHEADLNALSRYGHHVVPVADTSTRCFSEFERDERPLRKVLDLWKAGEGQSLYVKDWHLLDLVEREGRKVNEVYEVPEIFRDDWMNPGSRVRDEEFAEHDRHGTSSDFRFCYVGPAGTFTPLHRDVYGSYSWSANVVGRKLWWFYPPHDLDSVKRDGELVFDVRELEDEGGGIKIVQEEGEIIFVPSGWHHQVLNLDFCISINHNFASSPTIPYLFEALCVSQQRVEESISDVKEMIQQRLGKNGPWEEEWVEEVQGLLERDAGWGWSGFWDMIWANTQKPPAPASLSPPRALQDQYVLEAIRKYRNLPCSRFLPAVNEVVDHVERAIRSAPAD
ncbi:hypothetical protein BD324DRAFT_619872 [Kockovaella imperatae]|uniref:JmjC domain-containing protein n=1 Tax=Kockovaella imperatae TaxID=4999 RepID=A0A1Y1UJD7_9TREE|nr:hypothetical protein BD324DRAFT_619872 [Kockovaella imperatae]ORX38180.1 hypothetical protein BD324DRAFT_619872 [Kockovaella imperatae]